MTLINIIIGFYTCYRLAIFVDFEDTLHRNFFLLGSFFMIPIGILGYIIFSLSILINTEQFKQTKNFKVKDHLIKYRDKEYKYLLNKLKNGRCNVSKRYERRFTIFLLNCKRDIYLQEIIIPFMEKYNCYARYEQKRNHRELYLYSNDIVTHRRRKLKNIN